MMGKRVRPLISSACVGPSTPPGLAIGDQASIRAAGFLGRDELALELARALIDKGDFAVAEDPFEMADDVDNADPLTR
jgi:hypothetical protein